MKHILLWSLILVGVTACGMWGPSYQPVVYEDVTVYSGSHVKHHKHHAHKHHHKHHHKHKASHHKHAKAHHVKNTQAMPANVSKQPANMQMQPQQGYPAQTGVQQ